MITGVKRPRDQGEADVCMANVLVLLSRGRDNKPCHVAAGRVFECKTCNRQFPSFQALGGHRASHKKSRTLLGEVEGAAAEKAPRVHECSICGLEFAVGQALGGHMRRHRVVAEGFPVRADSERRVLALDFDLNSPPRESDDEDRSLFGFGLGLQMMVDYC